METPVGKPQESLDQEDQLTASLMKVAYSDPDAVAQVEAQLGRSRFGKRSSSFWFQVETLQEEVERRKAEFKPKQLEHVDAEIETRLKTYKNQFPGALRSNISAVREFFLNDVAPLTVAASAGTTQAREVVERFLGTKIDSAVLGRFENMVSRAAVVKLGLFVLDYFNLPPEHLSAMFGGTVQGARDQDFHEVLKVLSEMQQELKKQKNSPQGTRHESKRNRPPRS